MEYIALNNFKSYLSQLKDEDLIWVIYVYNRPNIYLDDYNYQDRIEKLEEDCCLINRLENFEDIRNFIFSNISNLSSHQIYDFLDDLKEFQHEITFPNIDYSHIKSNKRLLGFLCGTMIGKISRNNIPKINNLYFKFLYILYTNRDFNQNPRILESALYNFDKIYTKFNQHFNIKSKDFLIWAKKYISDSKDFTLYKKQSYNESEYEDLINSTFDLIYYENENIHYALRKKLSNAWYQKKHREDSKVKKENYYALTKKTREALLTLAIKYNLSEDKVSEKLVNEYYIKECCSTTGENLYLN